MKKGRKKKSYSCSNSLHRIVKDDGICHKTKLDCIIKKLTCIGTGPRNNSKTR